MTILCFTISCIPALKAQTGKTDTTHQAAAAIADTARVERIKVDELPEEVKRSLSDEKYIGWVINAAFLKRADDHYEVELKNGDERRWILFDSRGKRIN